jgi:hypothetical protein
MFSAQRIRFVLYVIWDFTLDSSERQAFQVAGMDKLGRGILGTPRQPCRVLQQHPRKQGRRMIQIVADYRYGGRQLGRVRSCSLLGT